MSTLGRRVGALERTVTDRVYRRAAERLAATYGRPPATVEAELRAFAAEVFRRFGPDPDIEAVARRRAAERGLEPEQYVADVRRLLARPRADGS